VSDATATSPPDWGRYERISLLAAAAGAIAFVALAFTPLAGPHPLTQAAVSYSVAFHFWLGLPLGCLVLLMVQYLSGGAWGVLLRPILEVGAGSAWLAVVAFLPVAGSLFLGAESPYPWARPLESVATGEVLADLQARAGMLNPPVVLARSAGYFAVWLTLITLLRAWSVKWRVGDGAAGRRLPAISGPGLVLYGVVTTFAAIDWVMSLEPFWISTMYPPIYAVGHIVTGLSFATAAAALLSAYPPLAGRVTAKHFRDLGGLMLTFVMFWAYLSFSQFLLIWVGNLPDEIPYYLKRMRGGWQYVAVAVIGLHFFAPFFLLLFRQVKDHPRRLLGVALGVLVIRFVCVLWWVEPAFPHEATGYWLLDIAAGVALGGAWGWWILSGLRRADLTPVHGDNQCEPEASHA
jgi:hypothetical protein